MKKKKNWKIKREIENTNNVDEIYGNVNDINDVAGTGRANPAPTKDEKRPYIPTLGNMIAFFKYQTTKIINLQTKLWQRNYHEHIIRNENAYLKISEYVKFNPALWNEDILNPVNENLNKEKYGC